MLSSREGLSARHKEQPSRDKGSSSRDHVAIQFKENKGMHHRIKKEKLKVHSNEN